MLKFWMTAVCVLVNVLCPVRCFSQVSKPPIQHDYIDDDDQRPLADLRFDVEPENPQSVKITVSATGPNVEPIAGFRGIRGTNRYTAEELELILQGTHVVEVVTKFDDGQSVVGQILKGRHGTLPERRLIPRGRIDFLARTDREYPLELVVDPQTSSAGRRRTDVIVNGRPRLHCEYDIVNGRIQGLRVQSLGGHSFLANTLDDALGLRQGRFILTSLQETKAPVTDADWNLLDAEGKWVLLSRQIASEPAMIRTWVPFLKQKKEFQLLEWMAIYIPDAFKSHGVADALVAGNAPQWIRVVVWHSTGPVSFGHGEQVATSHLSAAPGIAEHWLTSHKSTVPVWEGLLTQTYDGLKQDKFPPVDSSDYLPPLQTSEVFAHLAVSEDVADFADRRKAEPGAVYKHQIIREIDGVVVSGLRNTELLRQVRQLTHHSDIDIRQAAFLAHSYILPQTASTERQDDIVATVDNAAEPARIREAALLALSYHNHPSVLLKLHQVAADPNHPAWKAAVSRLGDTGRGFSNSLLQSVQRKTLTSEQSALLADSLKRLIERESRSHSVANWDMSRRISLAVFAGLSGDPNADAIRKWVINTKSQMTDIELADLKSKWDFSKVNDIWLPTSVAEFAKAYDQLRAEVVK